MRRFWEVVEETRQAFERAGFEKARQTHFEVDESIDTWTKGGRTVASCSSDGKTIWISPRIFTFDEARQRALVAHELGHAVQGFYGDAVKGRDEIERDADLLAERVLERPLWYSEIDGRLIQTFCPLHGVRPRPKGLR